MSDNCTKCGEYVENRGADCVVQPNGTDEWLCPDCLGDYYVERIAALETDISLALEHLTADHVQNNKHHLGTLGAGNINLAVSTLRRRTQSHQLSTKDGE